MNDLSTKCSEAKTNYVSGLILFLVFAAILNERSYNLRIQQFHFEILSRN